MLPVEREVVGESLNFDVLATDSFRQGFATAYQARDGKSLFYRLFESESKRVLVLLHGSGSEGRYLTGLAHKLSSANVATDVVPDLRGHEKSVVAMQGDVDVEHLDISDSAQVFHGIVSWLQQFDA